MKELTSVVYLPKTAPNALAVPSCCLCQTTAAYASCWQGFCMQLRQDFDSTHMNKASTDQRALPALQPDLELSETTYVA